MEDLKLFKAFIRVVKSINTDNFYNAFGKEKHSQRTSDHSQKQS
jgi:hypothetical protein